MFSVRDDKVKIEQVVEKSVCMPTGNYTAGKIV